MDRRSKPRRDVSLNSITGVGHECEGALHYRVECPHPCLFFASPPVLCHGDFHPGNVLLQGSRVSGVLDWDYAQISCAEFDLAYAMLTFSFPRADGRLHLPTFHSALQVYMTHRPLDFRLLDFMIPVAVLCLNDWVEDLPSSHPQRAEWLAHCVAMVRTRPWESWHGSAPGRPPGQ